MTVREWDGSVYDRISAPMEALGRAVLDRLELGGDETVIDAGCGSGRVTEALLARLPRGRVIAVDASASMVAAARERLAGAGIGPERVEVREGDLLELEVDEPVDAILSTATFHWIARPRSALRAGCAVRSRPGDGWWRSVGGRATSMCCAGSPTRSWNANRTPRTSATGGHRGTTPVPRPPASGCSARAFTSAECWLQPAPQQPEHPREFLSSIVLGPHFQQLPEDLREPFLDTVLAELGEPVVVDYIRLNLDAVA